MIRISANIRLQGPWKAGFALDLHTIASTHLGVDELGRDQFKNRRTELGQLLYELKYQGRIAAVGPIVNKILERFKGFERLHLIVPVPPSNRHRPVNAVLEIAKELGRRTGVPVGADVLTSDMTAQLKNISDASQRRRLLKDALRVSEEYDLEGKNILLLDDLYRSGATLSAATELLYARGAGAVAVLTITKTRTIR